jgi:hypothetical protein
VDRIIGPSVRSAAVVLAVTLQRLMDDPSRDWSVEEAMVLDALRRSKSDLSDATPEQLGAYLSGMNPDQFRGVVSNVKGIYHEMLVATAENSDGDGITAAIAELSNQPGHDLEFSVDGEVVRLVQLKAVADPDHILRHLERYPGIDVMATEEVAILFPGVVGTGFKNADLEREVRDTLSATHGSDVTQELVEATSASLLVTAAFAARNAVRAGRVDPRELRAAMGDLGVGLGTALALEVILTGG